MSTPTVVLLIIFMIASWLVGVVIGMAVIEGRVERQRRRLCTDRVYYEAACRVTRREIERASGQGNKDD